MKKLRRLIPVICVTIMIILIPLVLYNRMMEYENRECWKTLEDSVQAAEREIAMKFQDEIVKMEILKNLALQGGKVEDQIQFIQMDIERSSTLFSRIDICYPDGTVLLNGGEQVQNDTIPFEEAMAKGGHMTTRMVDDTLQTECLYYILPVEKENGERFILAGVIECAHLSEVFKPTIYDGDANYVIVDARDGNFLMDSWHEELGNLFEADYKSRTMVKGYESVDYHADMVNKKTNTMAFVSRTTGDILYMYYTPIEEMDWQLEVFVKEKVAFANMYYLKKLLYIAGISEVLLLAVYFVWNIHTVTQLERSNAEIEEQKEQLRRISYKDMLTGMYNRNKYIEIMELLTERSLDRIGVVYMDLNGLKQINDQQSHKAGDQYICQAAESLKQVFGRDSYRIGGDEFVVVALDVGRENFSDRIRKLKETLEEKKVSVSIGCMWEEQSSDLNKMIKQAEERMYAEKGKHYQTHDKWR